MSNLVVGQLVTFFGKVVRIRGSHFQQVPGQWVYDLVLPLPDRVFDYGVAVSEELEPLRGMLFSLLYYMELGHCAFYPSAGLVVRYDGNGLYGILTYSSLSSDPVCNSAFTPIELFRLIEHSAASSPQWELQ